MVRRGRARPVTPPPTGQRRLEEALRDDREGREESDRPRRSGPRGSPEAPSYEQRLSFWFLQREEAISERLRTKEAGDGPSPLPGPPGAGRSHRPVPPREPRTGADGDPVGT